MRPSRSTLFELDDVILETGGVQKGVVLMGLIPRRLETMHERIGLSIRIAQAPSDFFSAQQSHTHQNM